MDQITLQVSDDPVVIYDVLLESRTRLIATYIAAGHSDEEIVQFAVAQDDRVAALDLDDLDGQRRLTDQFRAERDAIAS